MKRGLSAPRGGGDGKIWGFVSAACINNCHLDRGDVKPDHYSFGRGKIGMDNNKGLEIRRCALKSMLSAWGSRGRR
ncbi:hypothetical protein CEXT_496391 [Caerostris extrusa]|uniref:Uncharacterized protein n=1 Tax=Caerostris extrusa TaxID=172846 RepID=A0AAV4NSX8_CAEEX|nr:hypothetical protein CEXT_496391 [Caerostris extrusa]